MPSLPSTSSRNLARAAALSRCAPVRAQPVDQTELQARYARFLRAALAAVEPPTVRGLIANTRV